jgi:DNA-binding CsgD family transcriptional regulator
MSPPRSRASVDDPPATSAIRDVAVDDAIVDDAVRRLIGAAAENDPPDASVPDVLVDREVDGFRCILVARRVQLGGASVALSPREQEIARMVAKGYPNKTIAAVLEISPWTVSTHLRRVFAKLDVRTRAAMVARVLGEHLIPD